MGNIKLTHPKNEIFIDDLTDWIYIDEGFGDKYAHAQGHYFAKDLSDETGKYNYKYINNQIVEA